MTTSGTTLIEAGHAPSSRKKKKEALFPFSAGRTSDACLGWLHRQGDEEWLELPRRRLRFWAERVLGMLLVLGTLTGCGSVSLCDQDGDGLCPPTEDCDDTRPGAWCEPSPTPEETPTESPSASPELSQTPGPQSPSITPSPSPLPAECLWYPDEDGDGFGDSDALPACEGREGLVQDHSDCNDAEADNHPGATEFCDGADNDCDGDADETEQLPPGGSPKEQSMLNSTVTQPVLFASLGLLLGTPLLKVEGCDQCSTWYQDVDGDGYGDPNAPVEICSGPIPSDVSEYALDCDDTDVEVFPGAYDELGDGLDGNCDGGIDVISTWVGTGLSGSSGDGGSSTAATVAYPQGVSVDSKNVLYIADTGNNKIRKVTAGGVITTLAGTGTNGYGGDGGPATSAKLNQPTAVWTDSAGVVYIADTFNYRIRKVDTAGTILTLAGNGTAGFTGDGGAATAASINMVYSLAGDSQGNLYLAEYNGHRIRKVSSSPSGSTSIMTVAGTGTSGYSGDGGLALAANLFGPEGVAVNSANELIIADTGNNRVRKVDASGVITTIAGTGVGGYSGDGGPATSAQVIYPYGLSFDILGNLYVADRYNGRVRKVDGTGTISTVAGNGSFSGSGDGGTATQAGLGVLTGLAAGPDGSLYIPIFSESKIRKVVP